jgi:hypothetical protein
VKKRRRIEFSPGVPSEAGVTYKLSVAWKKFCFETTTLLQLAGSGMCGIPERIWRRNRFIFQTIVLSAVHSWTKLHTYNPRTGFDTGVHPYFLYLIMALNWIELHCFGQTQRIENVFECEHMWHVLFTLGYVCYRTAWILIHEVKHWVIGITVIISPTLSLGIKTIRTIGFRTTFQSEVTHYLPILLC